MAFSPETYALLAGKGGGGGGSFPTPTAADVGSALTVQKVPVQGATIAPEQSVTFPQDDFETTITPSSDIDDLFVDGTRMILEVDGEEFLSSFASGGFVSFAGGEYSLTYDSGDLIFFSAEGEATTVACYVADYAYEYALDSAPAYDLVIESDFVQLDTMQLSDFHITKGDIFEMIRKVRNGERVSGLCVLNVLTTYDEDFSVNTQYQMELGCFDDGYDVICFGDIYYTATSNGMPQQGIGICFSHSYGVLSGMYYTSQK